MATAEARLGTLPTYTSIMQQRYRNRACSMSMNGCGAGRNWDVDAVNIRETRKLPAVSVPESAMLQLRSAVQALTAEPPRSTSGIIRIEVPIRQRADAINWLHGQLHHLPRCYFSGRGGQLSSSGSSTNAALSWDDGSCYDENLVSVAGVGSGVFFHGFHPFSFKDWRSIKRFLSKDCPYIRAYGAIRFDARSNFSLEWQDFGSFYFTIPQVEFNEFEDSSILATNIAWDKDLSWTWEKAVDALKDTMSQISLNHDKIKRRLPRTAIISCNHVPDRVSWDSLVKTALKMIRTRNTELVKVVLARCSNFVTDTPIDPVALLACLQMEGQNAYQFYIQPPDAAAFIGNTPEQLFHRKDLNIFSEALAGTRSRGKTKGEDLLIGEDLLLSPKDGVEFAIVRESIRRKLELICKKIVVHPSKALRKLPRVQHLSAQLSGRLRTEDDEYDILASLHPTPAVCGLLTEEARQFIEENEMFDRGMYAGPVGWFGGRESEFAVGIRSALVGKGLSTSIYAGAGIVDGTIASSEWEELDLKASQFTKLLQHREQYAASYREINLTPSKEWVAKV